MLSSVFNSERAIQVNIQIIRLFARIRELLIPNKDILQKLMDLENKGIEHDKKIKLIFEYLHQLRNSISVRVLDLKIRYGGEQDPQRKARKSQLSYN